MARPTRACPRSPVPSPARTGTALASLGCAIEHERHDEEGAGSGSALRDLHPCLDRARARAGVQLTREPARGRPMKVEDRSRILKAIARGRTWLQELLSGQVAGTDEIAIRERCSERSIRMTLSLAFLSPEVVQAIIAGRLPRGIGMTGLADLPPSWNAQHATLGV